MVDLAIINKTENDITAYEPLIEAVCEEVLKIEGFDAFSEVSIIFVSKDEVQAINREYRHIDQVTDVISFALLEDEDVPQHITTLGDIFICFEKAVEQAKDYNHSLERELGFLVCHGMLHLLGYDHNTTEEEQIMFTKQEEVLIKLELTRGSEENE